MADPTLTRDYLGYLRAQMGQAVDGLTPFDAAYAQTDWSRYERLPALPEANRGNAYNTYLLMEKESVGKYAASASALHLRHLRRQRHGVLVLSVRFGALRDGRSLGDKHLRFAT